MTKTIKALCKTFGVKNSVRKYSGGIYVTFLSCPSAELVAAIEALDTTVAHGDLMNDTRWYSGTAIHLRYKFEPSPEHISAFQALRNYYGDENYHFQKAVVEKMGPAGRNMLDNNWRSI